MAFLVVPWNLACQSAWQEQIPEFVQASCWRCRVWMLRTAEHETSALHPHLRDEPVQAMSPLWAKYVGLAWRQVLLNSNVNISNLTAAILCRLTFCSSKPQILMRMSVRRQVLDIGRTSTYLGVGACIKRDDAVDASTQERIVRNVQFG